MMVLVDLDLKAGLNPPTAELEALLAATASAPLLNLRSNLTLYDCLSSELLMISERSGHGSSSSSGSYYNFGVDWVSSTGTISPASSLSGSFQPLWIYLERARDALLAKGYGTSSAYYRILSAVAADGHSCFAKIDKEMPAGAGMKVATVAAARLLLEGAYLFKIYPDRMGSIADYERYYDAQYARPPPYRPPAAAAPQQPQL